MSVVVEVAEHRANFARRVGNAGILRLNEPLACVEHEDAAAGAIQKVRPAIAVDIAHGQSVALQIGRDAFGAEADLFGDIFEPSALWNRALKCPGGEVK